MKCGQTTDAICAVFDEVDCTIALKATMMAETEISCVQITIHLKPALLRQPY